MTFTIPPKHESIPVNDYAVFIETALPIDLRRASLRRWPLVMNGRALTNATGPFSFSIVHLSFVASLTGE